MNIILKSRVSTCSNSLKYLGTLYICMMYKNLPQFFTFHFQIKSIDLICSVVKYTKNIFKSMTIIKQ